MDLIEQPQSPPSFPRHAKYRTIACELLENSKELRNIYRCVLATGHQQQRPTFQSGTHCYPGRDATLSDRPVYYYLFVCIVTVGCSLVLLLLIYLEVISINGVVMTIIAITTPKI